MSRLCASALAASSAVGFYSSSSYAQENTINGIKIEKLFKQCSFGQFTIHHYYVYVSDSEQKYYDEWVGEFDSAKLIMIDVCDTYKDSILRDVEREIVNDRLDAANKCADQEAAAMAFREFGRAKAYTTTKALNLMAIRAVIVHSKSRDATTKDAQEAPNKILELLMTAIPFGKKVVTIGHAIEANAAGRLFKDMIKDESKGYAISSSFNSIFTDKYAENIKYNYDRMFGGISLLSEVNYECKK